jgi:hypothetical protein
MCNALAWIGLSILCGAEIGVVCFVAVWLAAAVSLPVAVGSLAFWALCSGRWGFCGVLVAVLTNAARTRAREG